MLVSLLVFAGMFIARWNHSPIKERGRSRYTILIFVFSFNGMALEWNFLNFIPWQGLSCAPVVSAMAIFFPFIFVTIMFRLYDHYHQHTLVQEQLAFAALKNGNRAFDEAASRGIARCHVWKRRMNFVSVGVAAYTLVLLSMILATTKAWEIPLEPVDGAVSPACNRIISLISATLITPIASTACTWGVFVVYKFRKHQDNFYIKNELFTKFISLFWVTAYSILQAIPAFIKVFFMNNFDYGMITFMCTPAILYTYYNLGFVVWKSYSREFNTKQMANQSETGARNSTRAPGPKSLEAMSKQFLAVLNDQQGFTLFQSFLEREWAVENIMFWKACVDYSSNYETLDDKVGRAKQITAEFILENAPLCVNLSYQTRENLKQIVMNNEDEINAHLFHEAEVEIFNLMLKDAFRRFVFRGDSGFNQIEERLFMSSHAEVQVVSSV
jgi:hypothetical protein